MNSIIELLEEHGIDFKQVGEHKNVRSGFVGVDCPYCGPGSQKYHLGISIESGYASCWQCGYHDLSKVLTQLIGRRIDRKTLESFRKGKLPTEHPDIRPIRLPTGRSPLALVHRRYLAGRGLDADLVASRWGLEGIGIHAILGWRIFIPVHLNGRIVSWTTRSIGDHPVRYMSANSERDGGMPIKDLLYGEDFARHTVVVVEGPADAWKIGPGAAATFGIAFSQEQVVRLSRFPVRVVCFDAEPQAQRAARRLCEALQVFPGETLRVILPSGDPGEASDTEIMKIRQTFLDV